MCAGNGGLFSGGGGGCCGGSAGSSHGGGRLVVREFPEDLKTVFLTAGTWLFPEGWAELEMECSCPDWANPCKHVAAVAFLLTEQFDRDPWQYLLFRGITQEEFLRWLEPFSEEESDAQSQGEPLPADLTAFWEGGKLPSDGERGAESGEELALLERLGYFPGGNRGSSLGEWFAPIYSLAPLRAWELLEEEDPSFGEEERHGKLWSLMALGATCRLRNLTKQRWEPSPKGISPGEDRNGMWRCCIRRGFPKGPLERSLVWSRKKFETCC